MRREIIIPVGKSVKIKVGFLNHRRITYAGMPNEKVFSFAQCWNSGYAGWGYNIFYPVRMVKVKVEGIDFEVLEVNPFFIRLAFNK